MTAKNRLFRYLILGAFVASCGSETTPIVSENALDQGPDLDDQGPDVDDVGEVACVSLTEAECADAKASGRACTATKATIFDMEKD